MYKPIKPATTPINRNTSYKGETIEKKIQRIVNNKEPIKDGAPLTYTDRKNGVIPEYDIRTDRFEQAVEMADKITAMKLAERDKRAVAGEKTIGEQAKQGMQKENSGEPGTAQTTN